jgi:hypothetical protein
VRVESVLGRGTTFELYLPIARDQEPAISKEPPVAAPRLFMSGRVLLVEDLAPLREVLAKHLRHAGLEVIAATMEADGVRGSLRHPPAALIRRGGAQSRSSRGTRWTRLRREFDSGRMHDTLKEMTFLYLGFGTHNAEIRRRSAARMA